MRKQIYLATTAAIALAACGTAVASITVGIAPTGSGTTYQVSTLQWAVGSALSVANSGQNLAVPAVNQTFTTYAMGSLNTFNGGSGLPVASPSLASTPYQWSYVAGFQEQLTGVSTSGGNLNLNFKILNNANNFFNVYYSPTVAASNLTGKGFYLGTQVLSASGLGVGASGTGTFSITLNSNSNNALDQFNTSNYTGYTTNNGNGSSTIDGLVTSTDAAFFPNGVPKNFSLQFTSQQKLAFNQADPASCFLTSTAGGGTYISGAGNGVSNGCGVVGDGGTIGLVNTVDGPNVEYQQYASTSFNSTVPEPASLALVGMGLAVMGATIGRRKKKA